MPTYPKIYVAIPRIGSGLDADNAFRPDVIGESGTPSQWPRHSKVWTVFGKHPTHVIAGVETERAVLDNLRSKPGVRFLGNTIEDARSDMAISLSRLATDGRAALQTVYDRNPARYSLLGPSPVFLINEPVISPPGWRDSEGAVAEWELAKKLEIPIFFTDNLPHLWAFIEEKQDAVHSPE